MAVVSLEAQQPPAKREFNVDYIKTPHGMLRIAEAAVAFAALICTAEGYCLNDTGRYGYQLFVIIVSMVQALFIVAIYFFRFEDKIPVIDVPLTILLNDGIVLVANFITSTLSLLGIGWCEYQKAARVIGALFLLGLFIVLIGLNYLNYVLWVEKRSEKQFNKNTGTTITESSPTVLT